MQWRCLVSPFGNPGKLQYGWGKGVGANTCDRGVGDRALCEWRGRKFFLIKGLLCVYHLALWPFL